MNSQASNRKNWMPPVPKTTWAIIGERLLRSDFWARVGVCALLSLILWVIMSGWAPSFSYRTGRVPLRDLHAKVAFEYDDYKLYEDFRDRTRRNFLCLYANDTQSLKQLAQLLRSDLFELKTAALTDTAALSTWQKFYSPTRSDAAEQDQDVEKLRSELAEFLTAIENDPQLETVKQIVDSVILEIGKYGLIQTLEHEEGSGSTTEIEVYPKGDLLNRTRVKLSDVRIGELLPRLQERLSAEIRKQSETVFLDSDLVSRRILAWVRRHLPVTLTYDKTNTRRELNLALDSINMQKRLYQPGERLEQFRPDLKLSGIKAAVPLGEDDINLLAAEHAAWIKSEIWSMQLLRSVMFISLLMGLFGLIAEYLNYREPAILSDLKRFSWLLTLVSVTLAAAWLLALNPAWRGEIFPIMIFAILISIAYHIELGIFLSVLVSLVFSIAHGYGLAEVTILSTAAIASSLMCNRIRSRTTLVNLSLTVAAIVFPMTFAVHYLLGQPVTNYLLGESLWYAGGVFVAGLTITALLPVFEQSLGIQTDISLLELSDANHVLLKELVQRAPGTYNHSINVASISEAAAEAVGANGLLCRVGAYFHDIGKIRKPEYFIENQSGINKHDDLLPAMSTLVIIAHVKDGAELARIHRLPSRIIDLIEQHHGTTLVEYFFHRAERQQAEKAEELQEDVEEANFRYPGPKPQTLEAAVLMVSDAVESASRSLREPAPARIENLVYEIIRKKLEDGQFDECPISMNQLEVIQRSLIKSLNAMYHVRISYPNKQQSA